MLWHSWSSWTPGGIGPFSLAQKYRCPLMIFPGLLGSDMCE